MYIIYVPFSLYQCNIDMRLGNIAKYTYICNIKILQDFVCLTSSDIIKFHS